MSTDYYLACHKCKVGLHVAQDGLSGYSFYSGEPGCMKALGAFLIDHSRHPLEVQPEHWFDDEEYTEVEWPAITPGKDVR